ncbi:hypothetical protein F4805DRAFT_321142 [Annulohypoxylon moriforme]|nr:hypothetical protein F4805DRAFT_321142 [Annulohypoxylon moriforme]
MCKRILTHHMHHDVRTPMILDPSVENPSVYANPCHTRFHKCELCQTSPGQWLLASPLPLCRYHSCCLLTIQVHYCDEVYALISSSVNADEMHRRHQPEQCVNFALEHRHLRLPYLGHPEDYLVDQYPATWREDLLDVEGDWPNLSDETLFAECEMLYQLEEDAKTQFLVYRDMFWFWPRGHEQMEAARFNVEQAQSLLLEQKANVARIMNWALGDHSRPRDAFTPIWWMRMWALDHGEYRDYM